MLIDLSAPIQPAPRGIVNGERYPEDSLQVVSLAGLDPSTGEAFAFCTGSLIHEKWVLTAAHCVSDLEGALGGLQPYVLWGKDLLTEGYVEAIPWENSYADPTYDANQFIRDAGLVELASPRPDVVPMVLRDEPLTQEEVDAGTWLTFYGYGITKDGANDSGVMRYTTIPLISFDEYNLYAYASDTNVCNGDSGGPSTFEGPLGPEQIGINAFITPSCVGGQSGSTRVDQHIAWIQSHVPEIITDPEDLVVAEGGEAGGGRDWLDLGVDEELTGLGGRWPTPESGESTSGCATAHAPVSTALWLPVLALLGMKRRR